MEKIKSVISGHRKDDDAPHGETTSPTTDHSRQATSSEIPHPIYDQFTHGSASGAPTKTTDNAPHFSNTTKVGQNEPASALGTTSLRPDTTRTRPIAHGEEMSTASVKSGVIGYPQGTSHSDQTQGGTVTGSGGQPGVDGPIDDGHGRFGAPPSSRLVHGEDYGATHTPEMPGSTSNTGSDRAFPLAGGVTHGNPTKRNLTEEREPGTKEKQVGVHDGQGKEALAGAAAAATSSAYGPPHTEKEREVGTQSYHPEALAAATAAAANTHSPSALGGNNAQADDRHVAFRGSPDATSNQFSRPAPVSNVSDSRLHIPGGFPSPTPVDQSSGPEYFQSNNAPTSTLGDQHELRHTGTLDHPQTREAERSEHHLGRDGAIAGGLGAAAGGAYAAGRHGQDEPTQTGDNIFPTEASPYSSKQVDPRVDNRPAPSYDQQKFDPTTSSNHQGRDAVLTGGSLPIRSRDQPTTQTYSQPTTHTSTKPTDEKSQHHYGRDAALVGAGAGAATTAGMYANQRANEPDSGPAKSTIGPHKTDIANVLDPRVQPDPALQKHHHAAPTQDDPAPSTVGHHKSDVANVLDPRVQPDPQKQKAHPKEEHHYGRDAAAVGGLGAAGAGTYAATRDHSSIPSTSTADQYNNPFSAPATHQLAVAQQHYNSTPATQHAPSTQQQQSTPLGELEPQESQHQYGRDAAVVGGLGAAGTGAGAYAATRGNDDHTQKPDAHQATSYQPVQQSTVGPSGQIASQPQTTPGTQQDQHHYGRDAAVVGGLGAAGAGTYAATRGNDHTLQPAVPQQSYPQTSTSTQQPQHHYGRDAAVAGGLGAAGAGTYAATRGDDRTQQPAISQQQPQSSSAYQPHNAQDPNSQHHKRDAAAVGAAGAAAGAGGAYAYSQHDAEKERKAAEKAHEHELKEQQKELEKQQKAQHKADEKAAHDKQKADEKAAHDKEKELEHQHAKDQKHHEKLVAAEEHKRQKELEKEQHAREKEAEKAHPEEEGEKKKHGLFGFLHRDKDKRTSLDENDRPRSGESPRHSKEYAGAGAAAGLGGAAAYEGLHESDSDGHKTRNKLHKEPPPGHPAREAMEHQQHSPISGKHDKSGTDAHGDHRISSGVYSADDSYSAQHQRSQQHQQTQDGRVIEPHTGLPMNVEKYGTGAGGTDGNPNLRGYHELSPEARQGHGTGEGVTDWDAIKKKNTPY